MTRALPALPAWPTRRAPAGGPIILSLDAQWLKVVQVSAGLGQTRTISALCAIPLQGMSDEDVLAQLRATWDQAGRLPGPVWIAATSQVTTLRVMNLPSSEPRELQEMVSLQAEQQIPYAKSDLVKDFRILRREPSGYTRVLLIMAHQDVVQRALQLVEAMAWHVERVGCEVEGLVHWLRVMQAQRPSAPHEGTPAATLVADVDHQATSVVVVHDGQPLFHRSIAIGVTQLLFDPTWGIAKFIEEFQRSLETFDGEGLGVSVGEVVLTGAVDRLPDVAAQVQKGLNLPTTVQPPFGAEQLSLEAMKAAESVQDVSLASLVGLALAPTAGALDLTPPRVKTQHALARRSRVLMTAGYQVIGVMLLLSLLAVSRAHEDQQYHRRLLQHQRAHAAPAQQIESSLEQLALVKDRVRHRGQLLEVLTELAQLCPTTLRLESLTYTQDDQLALKGVSSELPQVFEFVSTLESSPKFERVEARRVTKRKVEGADVTEFDIACPLTLARPARKPAEGAGKAAKTGRKGASP